MATPPPPATAPAGGAAPTTTSPRSIPDTQRYPRLTSGQYRFTTANAIKYLDDKVARSVYRIVVKLNARSSATFSQHLTDGLPWTFAVRDFLQMVQTYDEMAMILPRRDKAKINKISCPTEIPESVDEFERDYVWNPRVTEHSVTISLMITTSKPYHHTFKSGQIFQKLQDNDWFVNLDRLETQEFSVKVGVLLFAHNRWANQEEIIAEIQQLIEPLRCDDIDVRVDRPAREFYSKDATIEIENGRQKIQKIYTRWPAIYAPVDIVAQLKAKIVTNWPLLQTDQRFTAFNCKQYMFIPDTPSQRKSRRSTPSAVDKQNYSQFLHFMRKQNMFLDQYCTVVILQNVGNIAANFTWTTEMANILNVNREIVGTRETLRGFLINIKGHSINPGERTIHSINREQQKGTYSLLVRSTAAAELRETLDSIVPVLQQTPAFKSLRVGGNHGAFRDENNLEVSSIDYLSQLGTSDDFVIEPTILDAGGDSVMSTPARPTNFNAPPLSRRRGKRSEAAKSVRPTAVSAAMLYRDVLHTTPLTNPYLLTQDSTQSTSSLSTSITTAAEQAVPPLQNMNSLIQNSEFQQMLSSLIQPHVQAQLKPVQADVTAMKEQMSTVQADTRRLASAVSTMERDIGPQLQAIMAHLGVQTPSTDATGSPQKKQCTEETNHRQGPLNPNDVITDSGPQLHQHFGEEDEAGQSR